MKKRITFKILSVIAVLILLIGILAFLLSGGNIEIIKSVFDTNLTKEEVQERLSELGIRGYVTVALLAMLQVVFTFLPAEPVQVISGISFGFPIGLLCCTVGVFLGNSAIFLLYKFYGERLRKYFVKNLHFDFDKIGHSRRLTLIIFILYFLPAIPYGMICFFAASFGMKYPRYITVTLLGSIPSIFIGVGLGHVAIASSWAVSITIFAIILVILAAVMIKRKAIFAKVNEYIDAQSHGSGFKVKKYNTKKLSLVYAITRIIFFLRGVKVRYVKKVDKIERPAILLVNHGSFIDFAYAGALVRKETPHFIVARLYFYKRLFAGFIRGFGAFPKSMFTLDIESAKNCAAVLREGGLLAMMPEARLSTAGRFEDIQDGTFDFIKKCRVPVYTVKIEGDYLASPKWGDGLRRGALVTAELELLFTKEDVERLLADEIREGVIRRLNYDEFDFLKAHPSLRYRRRTLAEGLENILTKCPKCKQSYTITTKKREIHCECCGLLTTLGDRYELTGDFPFQNHAEWYDWQYAELAREIEDNPDWQLSSRVRLKCSSRDGKTTLREAGDGICTLSRDGLRYVGSLDGEARELSFPIKNIYRLLFGAGVDFELYVGKEIYFFVPDELRSAVNWYMASKILYDMSYPRSYLYEKV